MSLQEFPTFSVQELKCYVFDNSYRCLCSTSFCGCYDGYCPQYDCALLDKLKLYTDRQWQNGINYVHHCYPNILLNINIFVLAYEVIDYLLSRKPRLFLFD